MCQLEGRRARLRTSARQHHVMRHVVCQANDQQKPFLHRGFDVRERPLVSVRRPSRPSARRPQPAVEFGHQAGRPRCADPRFRVPTQHIDELGWCPVAHGHDHLVPHRRVSAAVEFGDVYPVHRGPQDVTDLVRFRDRMQICRRRCVARGLGGQSSGLRLRVLRGPMRCEGRRPLSRRSACAGGDSRAASMAARGRGSSGRVRSKTGSTSSAHSVAQRTTTRKSSSVNSKSAIGRNASSVLTRSPTTRRHPDRGASNGRRGSCRPESLR